MSPVGDPSARTSIATVPQQATSVADPNPNVRPRTLTMRSMMDESPQLGGITGRTGHHTRCRQADRRPSMPPL
ncbi:hypothetical protein GCM10010277_70320 [Streptomyces longisporoflavus]|nr:hypothetical protein GCM10010277_70320 [Streptomyces longisporoflavus]